MGSKQQENCQNLKPQNLRLEGGWQMQTPIWYWFLVDGVCENRLESSLRITGGGWIWPDSWEQSLGDVRDKTSGDANVHSWVRTVTVVPGMCPASVSECTVTECFFQRDSPPWVALLESYPLVGLKSVPIFIRGSWHPLGSRRTSAQPVAQLTALLMGIKCNPSSQPPFRTSRLAFHSRLPQSTEAVNVTLLYVYFFKIKSWLTGKDPTHWKRPRCWGRLRAGGEWGGREWDGWMAPLTQ